MQAVSRLEPYPRHGRRWFRTCLLSLIALAACATPENWPVGAPSLAPYVATPPAVVTQMLDLARVGPDDVVYDLGCGDGRIVIEAARRGARAVGVELNPALVQQARDNVRRSRLSDRVEIREQDALSVDLSEATVVTVYLSRESNEKLRPRLVQLRPGARIVSHEFDMGDWAPTEMLRVWDDSSGFHTLYLWEISASRPRAQ